MAGFVLLLFGSLVDLGRDIPVLKNSSFYRNETVALLVGELFGSISGVLFLLLGLARWGSVPWKFWKADPRLQEERDFSVGIIDKIPAIVVGIGPEGTIRFINPAGESISGYSQNELLGMNCWKTLFPGNAFKQLKPLFRAFSEGELRDYELQLVTKQGAVRNITWNTISRYDSSDELEEIVGFGIDVTDRNRAEKSLRASERRLQAIVNNAPFGMHFYKLDAGGRLVFSGYNRAADRILGISHEQFVGLEMLTAFPALKGTEIPEAYHRVVTSGVSYYQQQVEYDQSDIQGTFEVVAFQTLPEHIAVFFSDVTSRKRAEESLRESEERFRQLFEEIPDAIFIETMDDEILDANLAASKMLGYSREELLSMTVPDLQAPEVRGRPGEVIKQELSKGRFFEGVDKRKDGTKVQIEVHNRQIQFKGQEAVLSVVRDVSDRKQAEEEKLRLEEQLRQSQKMEALGNLTGGIAHDFNNLLQALSGYIELLLLHKSEQDQDYLHLREMEKATVRATELVRRLLTFSRKVDARLTTVNFNDIIRDAITLLERTIPKMTTITTRLDQDLSVIPADASQMMQVVLNLVSNAVDAMEGTGTLTIETENFTLDSVYTKKYLELPPGEYILVKVTDTGKGMDEATRQRIFEPFFTTKEVGKGTGLGLSSSHGIVKEHKGEILCYSEPGIGTTFKMYLPVGKGANTHAVSQKKTCGSVRGGNETILVVDDEEVLLQIADEALSHYGYTVHRASSGEEAIDKFRQKKGTIDLIVMDLGMPGMGGDKSLSILLEIDPKARILVASGYSAHEIAKDPAAFGAAGFLSKPYRLDELAKKVRKTLDAS